MRALLKLILTATLLVLGVHSAQALETGTPAWTTRAVTLLEGPGAAYDPVGDVAAETRIYIERCTELWCRVRSGGLRGWADTAALTFGQDPNPPLSGPRLDYKSGGPGTVCLYEGHGFTGASICGSTGYVIRDLLLYRADNRFSSVSIEGNVSVTLCRDREFRSHCERINESQSALDGFLDNAVSSVRVY